MNEKVETDAPKSSQDASEEEDILLLMEVLATDSDDEPILDLTDPLVETPATGEPWRMEPEFLKAPDRLIETDEEEEIINLVDPIDASSQTSAQEEEILELTTVLQETIPNSPPETELKTEPQDESDTEILDLLEPAIIETASMEETPPDDVLRLEETPADREPIIELSTLFDEVIASDEPKIEPETKPEIDLDTEILDLLEPTILETASMEETPPDEPPSPSDGSPIETEIPEAAMVSDEKPPEKPTDPGFETPLSLFADPLVASLGIDLDETRTPLYETNDATGIVSPMAHLDGGQIPVVSEDQMEAALERVVRNLYGDQIERLIIEKIEKIVSEEISRVKAALLGKTDA